MKVVALATAVALSVACASSLSPFERALSSTPHWEAEYIPTPGNDRLPQLEELKERIASWGITIMPMPNSGENGWGRYYRAEKLILLADDVEPNSLIEILAHEAGHIFQPTVFWEGGQRAEGEMFAELVAQGVMKHYGYGEYVEVSNRYLLAYKSAAYVERIFRADVQMAVETIVGLRPAPTLQFE